MIPFKNLNTGFSFIEIMVALTLLGIFGSSLFLVQSNIFLKVSKTHQKLFFNQDFSYDMFQLKNKIQQAVLNKKSIDGITVQEHKKNPDRTINLKLLTISEQSELASFAKHVRIVKSTATYDQTKNINWFNLVYIPELTEEEPKEKNQPKVAQS